MTTDHNAGHVAEQFQESKQHPWRAHVEAYSFMRLIGDLGGQKVVDVACGEGHFTRKLREAGAAEVVARFDGSLPVA